MVENNVEVVTYRFYEGKARRYYEYYEDGYFEEGVTTTVNLNLVSCSFKKDNSYKTYTKRLVKVTRFFKSEVFEYEPTEIHCTYYVNKIGDATVLTLEPLIKPTNREKL